MKIVKDVAEMQRTADEIRRSGKRLGLVPTMGYLHEGHMSLVDEARKNADVVAISIYVNPTQFAPNEDLSSYPRDFARDEKLAETRGVDIIFAPSDSVMYPHKQLAFVEIEEVSRVLEGEFRPTHFKGVASVVAKLFNIVKPHMAVFGQKDAQQAFIIRKMVSDLNFDVNIVLAPIVREEDGLALSSRNIYLSEDERKKATVLYRSLKLAQKAVGDNERNLARVRSEMLELIASQSTGKVDYIDFVDPDTFSKVEDVGSLERVLALLAVRFGRTRLIDNMILETRPK